MINIEIWKLDINSLSVMILRNRPIFTLIRESTNRPLSLLIKPYHFSDGLYASQIPSLRISTRLIKRPTKTNRLKSSIMTD